MNFEILVRKYMNLRLPGKSWKGVLMTSHNAVPKVKKEKEKPNFASTLE